jgi:hypothetical protein
MHTGLTGELLAQIMAVWKQFVNWQHSLAPRRMVNVF